MNTAILAVAFLAIGQAKAPIQVRETEAAVLIETDALKARINKTGYVSGIAAGTLVDKKTGAHDLGFGLHIMDFLLGPGWKDDSYGRGGVHGDLPKHYVEGPQVCTQAKKLTPTIVRGKDFVAVTMQYRFTHPAQGFKAGSLWQQTLVFLPGVRYVLCGEQVTSVNDVANLFYRIDMPGHIRHKAGDTFAQVYLSYQGKIPAAAFGANFAPDEKFLYQRKEGKIPERMIRAYEIRRDGKAGPWLAGMTLDPSIVVEAWCHQRDYVCFIEELHGKRVRAGETFGAAYVVGYFDDVADMERTYDQYKGAKRLTATEKGYRLD